MWYSQLRVHNYNTSEKVASFEAHPDYIRAICVHPTQPFVLTASDDMTIKLWNWEMGWKCQQTFEGHSHYVGLHFGLAGNVRRWTILGISGWRATPQDFPGRGSD